MSSRDAVPVLHATDDELMKNRRYTGANIMMDAGILKTRALHLMAY